MRFLTCVDYVGKSSAAQSDIDNSKKQKSSSSSKNQASTSKSSGEQNDLLIISGGDGFEDFRNSGANPMSDVAGREDSTNHLLLWQVWELKKPKQPFYQSKKAMRKHRKL